MKEQKLSTYDVWTRGERENSESIIARSASQARYKYWLQYSDIWPAYSECFKDIRSSKIGDVQPSHYFGDKESFLRMVNYRKIDFAYQGMKVEVGGKIGYIVGANSSFNLNVLFIKNGSIMNCHPHWETTYYDNSNNIVATFKKNTVSVENNPPKMEIMADDLPF